MAKVTLPLMSGSASGSIGKNIVFFPWKGLHVVREWLKPSNPKTGGQGNQRMWLGGTGRACKPVQEDSYYIGQSRTVAPGGQTWVSYIVDYIITNLFPNNTAFETVVSDYEGHTEKAKWDSEAASLGLVEFDISYKSSSDVYAAGLQLYIIARFGIEMQTIDNTKFNQTPYTVAIGTWSAANIDSLIVDISP